MNDSQVPAVADGVGDAFHVRDAASADWVVRKVNEARARQHQVRQWAEKEIRRAKCDENFFLHRFEAELKDWTALELAKRKGRRKTLHLPAGSVGFRQTGPKLVIDDAKAVLSWARSHFPGG